MFSGIRELVCGLRPDLFSEFYVTMLRAFIDDSGSGGDSPWYVLAGYVSSVTDWDAFDPGWQAALDAPPKIAYFKASEAESLRGEFSGFTKDQRNKKLDSLIEVVQQNVQQAIYVRVKQKHYNRIIKANGVPDMWENAYYFLFPTFISCAVTMEKYFGVDDPIEFVFDNNERFEKPSRKLYDQLAQKEKFSGRVVNVLYRDDKKFLPLQAADMLAWQVRRRFSVADKFKRPHFEAAQKCLAPEVPSYTKTLSEADLVEIMLGMKEREQDFIAYLGLPRETQLWSKSKAWIKANAKVGTNKAKPA